MVVVGAGVMGSAAARALGERGVDTVLLEQFRVGHARGSSHGAGRIFRFSYQEPDDVRLAVRARDVWRALEERAGEELLIETGGIDSGPGAEGCAAALEACGVPGEWWIAREAEERFPGISLQGQDEVSWHPRTGVRLRANSSAPSRAVDMSQLAWRPRTCAASDGVKPAIWTRPRATRRFSVAVCAVEVSNRSSGCGRGVIRS